MTYLAPAPANLWADRSRDVFGSNDFGLACTQCACKSELWTCKSGLLDKAGFVDLRSTRSRFTRFDCVDPAGAGGLALRCGPITVNRGSTHEGPAEIQDGMLPSPDVCGRQSDDASHEVHCRPG